jgi:hypothetical protein
VLWVDHGMVQAYGEPDETVERYLRAIQKSVAETPEGEESAPSDSPIRISGVTVRDAGGRARGSIVYGQPASVEIEYVVTRPVDDPVVALTFHDVRGQALGGLTSRLDGVRLDGSEGTGTVRLVLSPVLFTRGSYGLSVAIRDSRIQRYLDLRARAASFMVEGPSVATREFSGHFIFPHRWEVSEEKVG